MTDPEVLDLVRSRVHELAEIAHVCDDQPLSDVGIDSLAAVGVAMSLEAALSIDINVSHINASTSINSLCELCRRGLRDTLR